MPTTDPRPDDAGGEPRSGDLLPADSVLTLEEYLAMQKTVADPTRFRVLSYLLDHDETTPSDLHARLDLDLDDSTLYYHLDKLVDAGLVRKRARNESEGGIHRYYQASALGETLLNHGVRELIAREWELRDAYSSE